MTKVSPTFQELEELRHLDHNGPVVMINVIKFRDGVGREKFQQYLELAGQYWQGAATKGVLPPRLIYTGRAGKDLGDGMDWDWVIIVEISDIRKFVDCMMSDVYQSKALPLREEALERTIFMVTFPENNEVI